MIEPQIELHCPRMSEIVGTVCDHYKLSHIDFLSDRRSRDVARPRHVAMYLAKDLTVRSLAEIARFLRRSDHTTVIHGVRTLKALLATDPQLQADVRTIRSRLEQRVMIREALEQSIIAA